MQVLHARMAEDVGTLEAHTNAAARLDMTAVIARHGSTSVHRCRAITVVHVRTASANTVVSVTLASRARDVR